MKKIYIKVWKLAKYERNCVFFWKNLHSWQNFYTTAGRDGRDKFQVWLRLLQLRASRISTSSFGEDDYEEEEDLDYESNYEEYDYEE